MNEDVNNIFSGYKKMLNENVPAPAAPAAPAADASQAIAQAEQLLSNGPGQDAATLQQQVQALTTAQQAIAQQVEQLNLQRDKVADQAAKGMAVPMDPSGQTQVEAQIQKLNDGMTQLSQLAQTIIGPAQQMGVDVSPLMESLNELFQVLQECANWYVKCLIPENDGASLTKRHQLKCMIFENTIPTVEASREDRVKSQNDIMKQDLEDEEPEYSALDMLGLEPDDFGHEDPDQAAMDRMDAEDDTVDLANHDRPSNGPEDGLMDDIHALERLLDDETKAVMDDEDGAVSRREAREIAKDIIKQMIDRL
jgi:cell division protein FtsB